jgi:hypothetical protein
VCKAPEALFGEVNSSSWSLRDNEQYIQKSILVTLGDKSQRGDARKYLLYLVEGRCGDIIRNVKYIIQTTIFIPGILFTVHPRTFNHWMDRVI